MDRQTEEDDVWEGLRLTGVAVASAFVTAALVIGVGGAVLPSLLDQPDGPAVIRVSANR